MLESCMLLQSLVGKKGPPKAHVLVTGDKDLLDVAEQVRDLTITDPRGFWNLAKKRPRK